MTTRITIKGLKGREQQRDIDGLSLAVGPNGSGKTTIAQALRYLALGYVPSLGKRPQDTAALMSDREMSVALELPDGRSIRRSIARQDRGFAQGAEASWMRNGKPTEISEEIKRLFGAEDVDAAECLDIQVLLSATPNERAARLEALAAAGRRTPAEVAEAVARFTVGRLADVTEDRMPENYMAALELVPAKQAEVLQANANMLLGKISDGGLTGAESWANEEKRTAAASVQGKEKAAQELRTRAAEVPEPAAEEVRKLEDLRQKLDRELGGVKQAAAGYQARALRRKAAQDELAAAKENRDRWEAYLRDEHADRLSRLQELRAALDEHRKAEPKPGAVAGDSKIAALRKEAADLRAKADALQLPDEVSTFGEERDVQDLDAALVEATKSPWSEVLQVAQDIEDAMTSKGTKTATAKPIQRLRALARANVKDPKEVKDALDHAHELLKAAKARQTASLEAVGAVTAERGGLRKQASQKDAEALQREQKVREVIQAAARTLESQRSAWTARQRELQAEVDTLGPETASATETAARAQDCFAAAEKAVAAAGPDEAPPATSTASLEAQIQKARVDLQRLQTAQALHNEIQRALAAIEDARAGFKVFSAIEWAVQRQREVEITEAGGPLLALMSEFFQAAGRPEKPFVRASAGTCAIGWTRGDSGEISVQSLSGGEFAIFAAALTTAVLVLRAPAVRFLLIEAGEMDETTLPQLLAGIAAFKARLTGALVMTPRGPARKPKGWTVISYAETAAVEAA